MKIVESGRSRTRTGSRVVLMTFSLALVGFVAGASGGCGRQKGESKLPPARGEGAAPLPTLPAVTAHDEGTVVAPTDARTTGTTVPRAESQIGPNAGGVIDKIFVKEGDRVRRGMVLFRQTTRDAELRLEQARAALESARVNLKATETELARTKGLFEQKAVSQMEWDQVQARADAARAGLQQAQVAVSIADKMLADCTVRSPLDGVVAAKLKSEGEMATMMPPTVVLIVQDQSVLELRFRLPQGSLGGIKAGQTVEANFTALGIKRPAKVTRIQPAVDPHTRTIEVVAEIANKDGTLKSGLLAEVELPKELAKEPGKEAGKEPGKAAPTAGNPTSPTSPTSPPLPSPSSPSPSRSGAPIVQPLAPAAGAATRAAAGDTTPSARKREGIPR